jgi:flagellin|uniref:flagellin N-terminal helical domain-containing protein n=1 Tax=Polynucleobacter sp. TaxID=2029855 RepID=UPI00404776E2
MSIVKENLVKTFTGYVQDIQSKISTINAELKTGKATLTTAQQAEVTKLSAAAKSYTTPKESIASAQKTIGLAQTGISAILQIANQMQQMASQATDPSLGFADSMNLNFRFQQMVTQIGKLATSAGLDGTNLLSGTAGMNVIIGTDKTAASRLFINNVNIYGMMTTGLISGITLDTPQNAQAAMGTLNSAISQIMGGQSMLKITSTRLDKQTSKIDGIENTAQSSIDTMQKIDPAKLRAQLTQLQNQQNIHYQLINQFDPAAYNSLIVANAISLNNS